MPRTKPDVQHRDLVLAKRMMGQAARGWFTGDRQSLSKFRAMEDVIARTEPSLQIRLQITKDKQHHSSGWWRNAEYEYCWHLSMSAWDRAGALYTFGPRDDLREDLPKEEERYWAHAFFPNDFDKLWHEPGGGDPETPLVEARRRAAHLSHLRLFLDPITMEPFIPKGEVYDLTRWVPGLTPDKVDR